MKRNFFGVLVTGRQTHLDPKSRLPSHASRRERSGTRSRTSSALCVVMGLLILVAPCQLMAGTVLVPIVSLVPGQNDAAWETEVRITNRTDMPRQFSVVDWIGTPGWTSATYTVEPHSTTSLGGAGVSGSYVLPAVGLAICDADPGLLVQSAILSGIWRSGSQQEPCPSYDGGGAHCSGPSGAGPIVDGLAFSSPGQEVYLPWLHSARDRRTNLVLINADAVPAHVTVSVISQDGSATATESYFLPPRSYSQINDLFSQEPWTAIYKANVDTLFGGAAASATIVSDTRLLAMATVISNNNNSLTMSLPR